MKTLSRYEQAFARWLLGLMTDNRQNVLPRVLLNRTRHLTVAVEDVFYSHNASACLRTCECFGIQDMHVMEGRNPFLAHTDIAKGATQWLTVHRYQDGASSSANCIEALKARGYAVVVTSPHLPDCDLETWDIRQKTALIFGNEHGGVSETVQQMADHRMRIPMHGFTESLNLSVAVALCLHHLTWRLRQSDVDWRLALPERERLLYDWIRVATGKKLNRYEQLFQKNWDPAEASVETDWPDWERLIAAADAGASVSNGMS